MVKESLSRYALAPWGMQPNTSPWRMSATTCAVSGPCLCCILYHIWGVRLITAANHCAPVSAVVVSIDSHSETPCFSVEFVDTYSIHSLPPPSRRTQQIQGFLRSGAGVSPGMTGFPICVRMGIYISSATSYVHIQPEIA